MSQKDESQTNPSLDQLARSSPKELAETVKRNDGLTQEAFQDKKRAHKDHGNENWAKHVRPKLHLALLVGVFFSELVLVILVSTFILGIIGIYPEREGVGILLGRIFEIVLISGATLFAESMIDKD